MENRVTLEFFTIYVCFKIYFLIDHHGKMLEISDLLKKAELGDVPAECIRYRHLSHFNHHQVLSGTLRKRQKILPYAL